VYKKTLQEWSAISRGSFHPSNIVEDWHTEDGPIEISFAYLDQRIVLHPKFLNDYIDLDILVQINDLIQEVQFELYQPFDQTGFVVALTSVEKENLQKKRKWLFAYP
jgi:hypothetical protein